MKRSSFLIICIFCLSVVSAEAQERTTKIQKSMTIITDVMRQLDMNYADTLNYERLTEEAIQRMLAQVDPYTVYIPKKDDDHLRLLTTGKYGGIGALIMQRDSLIVISEPYEGMPAQRNDVRAGDIVLKVNSTDCQGLTTREVSDNLRGEEGTEVEITLQREGEPKPLVKRIKRQEIHIPPISFSTVLTPPYSTDSLSTTGYILFSEFTNGSAMDVLRTLQQMVDEHQVDRLILDLRGNGGGIIDEAIQLVSFFVDKNTEVVTTKGKISQSNRRYVTSSSPLFRHLPLVVLVNGQSASAAEIVSGSLQDLHRAPLIGQRTFGKGLVQSIRPIAFEGHLKVTTAHYYLPSGRCIQAIDYSQRQKGNELHRDTAGGILPDIVISDSQKVDICYTLFSQRLSFDYATRYHQRHTAIAQPQHFDLSDEDLEDFFAFLEEKKFVYRTETSKFYEDMLRMAADEDIDSTTLQALKDFQPRLTPSYKEAILRNKEEVKRLLGADIVERYYFQRGRIAYLLRFDPVLQRAMEVIQSPDSLRPFTDPVQ